MRNQFGKVSKKKFLSVKLTNIYILMIEVDLNIY